MKQSHKFTFTYDSREMYTSSDIWRLTHFGLEASAMAQVSLLLGERGPSNLATLSILLLLPRLAFRRGAMTSHFASLSDKIGIIGELLQKKLTCFQGT